MNRANLLFSIAAVCGVGAILLEVVSTGSFGQDAILLILILLTVTLMAISSQLKIRSERQHRWVLASRVKKLEQDLVVVQKGPLPNAEFSSEPTSGEEHTFVADNYHTLASIYDRIQALESENGRDS